MIGSFFYGHFISCLVNISLMLSNYGFEIYKYLDIHGGLVKIEKKYNANERIVQVWNSNQHYIVRGNEHGKDFEIIDGLIIQ